MRARLAACALGLVVFAGEQPALANGRFPRAQRLLEGAKGGVGAIVAALLAAIGLRCVRRASGGVARGRARRDS